MIIREGFWLWQVIHGLYLFSRTYHLLPTATEGNVFTGVCHSVHNRSHAYSVTTHPYWLLGHLLWCGRYATYWNAFLSQVCIHDVTVMIQRDQMLHIDIHISQKKHNHNFWWFFSCHSNCSYLSYGKTFCPWLCEYTLQEDQTIRTFAIFQKFLTLKLVLWAMEKCTFSTIQPISEKISGKYIYRKI